MRIKKSTTQVIQNIFHIFEIASESKTLSDFLSNNSNRTETSDDKMTEIYKWCEQLGRAIDILLARLKLKGMCKMVDRMKENLNLVNILCKELRPNS
jgi:hypothetical protein